MFFEVIHARNNTNNDDSMNIKGRLKKERTTRPQAVFLYTQTREKNRGTKPSGDHQGHGLGLYVCAIACQGSKTILVKNAQRVKTKSRIFAINRRADRRNGKICTSAGPKAGRGESCGKSKRESAHNFSEQADRELGKEPDGKTTKPGVAQKTIMRECRFDGLRDWSRPSEPPSVDRQNPHRRHRGGGPTGQPDRPRRDTGVKKQPAA